MKTKYFSICVLFSVLFSVTLQAQSTKIRKVGCNNPTPIITGPDSVCPGRYDTLAVTGGTTYLWSTGATTTSISVTPTVTTTYTVTAFNGACSHDTTFTIHVIPGPMPVVSASKDTVCAGDTITLFGHGGLVYSWTKGSTSTQFSTDSTVHNVHITSDTTFKLYEYGATCEDSISISISMIPPITASISASIDSICPSGSSTLTAIALGGPATYRWSNGATTSSIVVTPVVTTTYTATVYGRCDSVQKTIIVIVIPLSVPVISGKDSVVCRGMKDTLTVSGPPGTTYLWSNGSTKTTYITGNIMADSNFKVYTYNSLGCLDSALFTIIERLPPVVTISPSAVSCAGTPIEIIATAVGTNSPFTFTWSTGATSTSVSRDTIVVNPSTPTTYTLSVSNGCTTTKTTTVTPDNPSMFACCNTTIAIGNSIDIIASGNSIVSYSWIPPVTCLNPSCDSVRVSPTVTTTYTVTGTDSLGCQVQRLITITVTPSAVPSISGTGFVNVYPNPSSTTFTVDLENKALLKVCDITGRILFSKMENAGTITFGKDLKPGMYFLFIDEKPGVKLVKQ